jgi:preprotein translocase subunit SecY
MKKLIETLKNIYKIEDLRSRLGMTLMLLAVYRFGSFVILPGIDPNPANFEALQSQSADGILGLLNMFSGGAFSNASIFALGIMPYISASIVIQLLGFAVPFIQRLQKEGESGRRKINQMTRYLTVIILVFQGWEPFPLMFALLSCWPPDPCLLCGSVKESLTKGSATASL